MDKVEQYIEAVVRGEGFLPWQNNERDSEAERAFRAEVESRKDALLATAVPVEHPAMLTADDIARARRNIEHADWAARWFEGERELANHAVAGGSAWVETMIPELTSMQGYGFTCPNCVGVHSQEGAGAWRIADWDWRNPEVMTCKACGQTYPDDKFPEAGRLVCPRRDQTITFYRNDAERADPDNRTGELAWKWVGQPMHISFTGIIREYKVRFMLGAVSRIAQVYAITGESRYAAVTVAILKRLAHCYRRWLYHDYFNCYADCDPMYAAWHDMSLPLEFKRHPDTMAYRGGRTESGQDKDTLESARMLARYFGAGRVHPSTDVVTLVRSICTAYDLTYHAVDDDGQPLWTDDTRAAVERDLILEYVMTGEPSLGGPGKVDSVNNKAPRMYLALAATAKTLGIVEFADTALRGYEAIRDQSFNYDGFSHESPSYTEMFLGTLLQVTEALEGFTWPADHPTRNGTIALYRDDAKLRLMLRSMRDAVCLDGRYLPLADTLVGDAPGPLTYEVGAARMPDVFGGTLPANRRARGERNADPSTYAVFALDHEAAEHDTAITHHTMLFPAWKTAILRGRSHAEPHRAATASLAFNPTGGHRHNDSLALYYDDAGQPILGDLGYIGDTPMNAWFKTTASHNLVVVDDDEQLNGNYRKDTGSRHTDLRFMFDGPWAAGVEASSRAYPQCNVYRRTLVMLRSPDDDGRTILVDIFRVAGGASHRYQLFSELGASDADDHGMTFDGLDLTAHTSLPNFGRSVEREHIYGLQDPVTCTSPAASWCATWHQRDRAYRLHMLTACDHVTAAHGPGQETIDNPGRRVRHVLAVRSGDRLASTFAAVHEPSNADGSWVVHSIERLALADDDAASAFALRLHTAWGDYVVFSDAVEPITIDNITFAGTCGVVHRPTKGSARAITCAASTCTIDGRGFENSSTCWDGKVTAVYSGMIEVDNPRPADWPQLPHAAHAWVNVDLEGTTTGHRVDAVEQHAITSERFPFDQPTTFRVPIVRVID